MNDVFQVRYATFGSRAGAWVVDAIPHIVVPSLVGQVTGSWIYALAGYFITGLVWSVMPEARTGSTVGKLLLGVKALDIETGAPIGLGRAGIRWLVKYTVCSVLPVGYLWFFRGTRRQAWHDVAARSIVVTPVMPEAPAG